jgi:hypothetical protein
VFKLDSLGISAGVNEVLLNSKGRQLVTSEKSSRVQDRSARLGSGSGSELACPSTSCILSFVERRLFGFGDGGLVLSSITSDSTATGPVLVNVICKDAPASVVSFLFTHAQHTYTNRPPEISRVPDKQRLPESTAYPRVNTLALVSRYLCPYKPSLLNLDTFYISISITLATIQVICLGHPTIVV